jgi:transitional endoplasmic reticulum ATPase
LTRRRGKALLLFEEMEDVLQNGERGVGGDRTVRRAGSKIHFNRLLEQNAVPVLWTTNSIEEFDPAFLRRMSFALEMKPLPVGARTRLWDGLAHRQGFELAEGQAAGLAQRYNVAPSLMSSAAEAVGLAGGGAAEIDFVMHALSRPLCRAARPAVSSGRFLPELVNADADLAALERALARPGAARDYSLCLYGPPGTGKSAFARHLAGATGLEPLLKRGSDLLSKWIGGTERLIAEAFEEARQDGRFLIIDEAEAFLWNRDGASRSWEVSMVNELLTAMETHMLPFACTTNHLDMIDPAALRRFSFKIKFDAMTPSQMALAYRQFFARTPPSSLRSFDGLTPGDFAVVAKRLRFLGGADHGDTVILGLLEQEVAVKNRGRRRIGY